MDHRKLLRYFGIALVGLIFFCAVFRPTFLSFFIYAVHVQRGTAKDITEMKFKLSDSNWTICRNSLLSQKDYDYEKWAKESSENLKLTSRRYPNMCQLVQYTFTEVVACLDVLHAVQSSSIHPYTRSTSSGPSKLHFVFMGDSRIRQQYYNFLRLVPDYDSETDPSPMSLKWRYDMQFNSELLRLKVSFLSRQLIDYNVTETLRNWLQSRDAERPYWILLSMAAHHMLQINDANFQLFRERLLLIAPILGQLADVSNVIWLNQYPTVDYFDENTYEGFGYNTDVYSEKIDHYNKAIGLILRHHPKIQIWDSTNPVVEEYVRSCTVYPQREAVMETFSLQYFSCEDYIHTGNAALSKAIQLLFNNICNARLY